MTIKVCTDYIRAAYIDAYILIDDLYIYSRQEYSNIDKLSELETNDLFQIFF